MPGSVLDDRSLGRLDRWRRARALFVRADGTEAERAVSSSLAKVWTRGQIYGRSRRITVDRTAADLIAKMYTDLGRLAENVRVAPEDPAQTKWDAIGNLVPLTAAAPLVGAMWLVDVIQSGSLFVEFQPIFHLQSGSTLGYEGLLRATGADGGVILAADLFPAAQRLGIEQPFEQISWVRVLESAVALPDASMLFLNVNPKLLMSPDASLSELGAEAERVQFPYARLALDLVEVERVESLEKLESALGVPHDLGVSIALDDVTSSYGTIQFCAGLAPRWIKIDSQITRGVATDPPRRAVLKLLAQVARDASVGLIAEGIEAAEDLDACVEEGVLAAQGYFLGRPARHPGPASEDFRRWLAARGGPDLAASPPSSPSPPASDAPAGEGGEEAEL